MTLPELADWEEILSSHVTCLVHHLLFLCSDTRFLLTCSLFRNIFLLKATIPSPHYNGFFFLKQLFHLLSLHLVLIPHSIYRKVLS